MPYISKQVRGYLDDRLSHSISAGELNYQLSMLAKAYVEHNGGGYRAINDVMGAFECAKLEFYRRVVVPYEQKKMMENGDIYPEAK